MMKFVFILEADPLDARPRLKTLEKQLVVHYRQSLSKVIAFFQIRHLDIGASEDLAQATFLQAFHKLDTYRGEQVVMTWIYQIAHSKYKNYLRNRNTQKRSAREVSPDDLKESQLKAKDPTPFEQLAAKEQLAILAKCMPRLPKKMRTCFTLFHLQQRSQADIAQIMKIHPNTVKSHIHQAREHLKACAARMGR